MPTRNLYSCRKGQILLISLKILLICWISADLQRSWNHSAWTKPLRVSPALIQPCRGMGCLQMEPLLEGSSSFIPQAQPWDADVLPRGAHRKAVMTWEKMACEHKNGRNLVCFKETRLTQEQFSKKEELAVGWRSDSPLELQRRENEFHWWHRESAWARGSHGAGEPRQGDF